MLLKSWQMEGKAMTNFISECIGDIISIADGDGDDTWRLENANACADVLVSSRPQVADDLRDRLTIEAESKRHSQAASHLLAEVRAYLNR
jgi:hypothetical protein